MDRLLREGRHVRALDNFSNGSARNLAHHKGNPALEVVEADLADDRAIDGAFKGADRVFHFAALADIVPSIKKPEAYFRSNRLLKKSFLP